MVYISIENYYGMPQCKAGKHMKFSSCSLQAVNAAEISLKETSKSKFLQSYSKVSQELEQCLNKFLLLSDALENLEESDSDEEEEQEEGGRNFQIFLFFLCLHYFVQIKKNIIIVIIARCPKKEVLL